MTQALKTRLLNYLRKIWMVNPNAWIAKGKLEDLTKQAGFLGDNGTRELRKLCEDGKIEKAPDGKSIKYRYCPDITEISNNIDKLI
jgi:hypothetical protein